MPSPPRILVIRGGAIGDFILTLPAIRLLRENFPGARLEILGYKHIIALAEGRFYADATRSIEYAPMAAFFTPGAELAPELVEYFSSFQQIVSYLYDPNGYFEANLRRAGARHILPAFSRISDAEHAALQLARPLQQLALYLENHAATIHPSAEDRAFARAFLASFRMPFIAIHPGSGSARKNWPAGRWAAVARQIHAFSIQPEILLIGGEADEAQLAAFHYTFGDRVLIARDLPLPQLAGVLEQTQLFLGHDSGISHLAAAVGAPCVLLFGATDPAIWAPANPLVKIIEAPTGDFAQITVERVVAEAEAVLAPPSRLD